MRWRKTRRLNVFYEQAEKAERVALKVANNIDIIGLNYGSSRYEIDGKNIPKE